MKQLIAATSALIIVALIACRAAGSAEDAKAGANSSQPAAVEIKDMRKMVIETPLKKLMAVGSAAVPRRVAGMPAVEAPRPRRQAGAEREFRPFVNPRVEPGLVRWHRDFDTACAAARTSGKPVLLFQMIGRLDERFT